MPPRTAAQFWTRPFASDRNLRRDSIGSNSSAPLLKVVGFHVEGRVDCLQPPSHLLQDAQSNNSDTPNPVIIPAILSGKCFARWLRADAVLKHCSSALQLRRTCGGGHSQCRVPRCQVRQRQDIPAAQEAFLFADDIQHSQFASVSAGYAVAHRTRRRGVRSSRRLGPRRWPDCDAEHAAPAAGRPGANCARKHLLA